VSFQTIMKILSQFLILLSLIIACNQVDAEPVQTEYNQLILNADLQDNGERGKPVFLLVHGTWATHKMEIMRTLQELLAEAEYNSLAISLSLGVSNRTENQDCASGIKAGQNDNLDELGHWINYLEQKGFTEVVLIAHSRAGAQVASFTHKAQDKRIKAQALIAPMVWSAESVPDDVRNRADKSTDKMLSKVAVLYCDETNISLDAYRSYYSEQPEKNTPTIIKNSLIKTIVYLGTDDELITENFLKQSALLEKNSNITTHIIDGADHFFRDLNSDEIVEHLIEELE